MALPAAGLKVESVSFSYNKTLVLHDIGLNIREGEFLTLLGPSGSGKTTLLRLLAGLEQPVSGRILCNGRNVDRPSAEIGMVFQNYALFPWMTLRENVALAVDRISKNKDRVSKKERRELAEKYLELVGLQDSSGLYPYELSGGMQQRGAIARVLALGSPFLLMDEPFGALDPVNRIKLQDLIVTVCQHTSPPRTIVFVTHDVDEALYLGDRVVIMGSTPGRVIADIPVYFPQPRSRQTCFSALRMKELRNEIVEYYRHDIIKQFESSAIVGKMEGI